MNEDQAIVEHVGERLSTFKMSNYILIYKNVIPWLLDIDEEELVLIKDSQLKTQPEDTLKIRGKGEHLDFAEKLLIYNYHIIDMLTPNEISRECNVNISTVNRIIFVLWELS